MMLIMEKAYGWISWLLVTGLVIAVGWIGLTVLMLLIALVWTAVQAIAS